VTHAAVLAGAFLFNLGQGVLRPTMPLYMQAVFAANYRMVTAIPTVFGIGKWIVSLPAGYLQDRLGRRTLMTAGLLVIAVSDVASAMASSFDVFFVLRALAGVGWAMFGTVATTTMIAQPAGRGRGRAVSLLLMSETAGLLLGSAAGGWVYTVLGVTSPLIFEAACMVVGAVVVAGWTMPGPRSTSHVPHGWRGLTAVLREPAVLVMGVTNAALVTVHAGVLVFLYPLYLVSRAGLGAQTVGLLIALTVLGRLFALWLGGTLSDRWGRLPALIPGLLAYAALVGTTTFITDLLLLALWSLMIGAASGFVGPLPAALVGDRVATAEHGIAVGWLRTMTDSGQVLGPLLMGALADGVDLAAPFLVATALLIASAWSCRFVPRRVPACS
jgi:DHA1 family multidrug resistance protein-like MFS transporter